MINCSIIANTLVLALDAYPVNYDLSHKLDLTNFAFFGLFFSEMVIKVLGFGPKMYIRDSYNLFDAFIGKKLLF